MCVCVCACVRVCVCSCAYMCMHVNMYTLIFACVVPVYLWPYALYIDMCACMVYMCAHECICVYRLLYIDCVGTEGRM